MELAKRSASEFVNLLASSAPAPGGGSAAALEGALGAALTAMVCCLSEGREKYDQELVKGVKDKALALTTSYLDLMERDTQSFNQVSAAYKMDKSTDEAKTLRSAAIQEGLKGCTRPPFQMMELAVEALELTASLLGKSNASAASDLGVSALSLRAAVQGAWLNVRINIGGLKDQELAEDYRVKGEALLAKALPLADQIYEAVVGAL